MITRKLFSRLERLEIRVEPEYREPRIICFVNMNRNIVQRMIAANGEWREATPEEYADNGDK